MIVLVCGGRDYRNRTNLFSVLDNLDIEAVIHGNADGADSLAREWAISRKIPQIIVQAQWNDFTKVYTVIAFSRRSLDSKYGEAGNRILTHCHSCGELIWMKNSNCGKECVMGFSLVSLSGLVSSKLS